MLRTMREVKQKVKTKELNDRYQRDVWSSGEFVKGLKSGKTQIGSILFTGSTHEYKLIKRLCSYFGVDLKGKSDILCGYTDCANKFYVTHYKVEY